ncbi:right-handed parallel beta-helix repeat-containing protein [Candidatus Laterigemmans baculatus]|uniref:right-handed parallel beta-helix repeat-containing protein n=1 Tax=Candidatus Laterigemmans baculatus TaxID=2770505 RepID=UPI0013DD50CA|nr:right-handed parallel beta-helix repeat-containing protein [Candidatus Laterigemmans baculatus]
MPISRCDSASPKALERRQALALLSLGGIVFGGDSPSLAADGGAAAESAGEPLRVRVYPTVAAMRGDEELRVGWLAQTLGYHAPGDGGNAVYRIEAASEPAADGGAVVGLKADQLARLLPGEAVNYRMFGAIGDGKNDDGVQIKQAHQYAAEHQLPIIQHQGEFWILNTTAIPITTNVEWGNTIFHIDERFNQKRTPRFIVENQQSSQPIEFDDAAKAAFLKRLGPGVQLIPEMAPYKNCLVSIADANDQIGFRAGDRYKGQSWDREELFYVEEDGRILGDIAWKFKDYTQLTATPCPDTFLIINGGGFYLSGDNPGTKYTSYYQNGFSIRRSRTKIQNQWVGLEPGKSDISMEPRSGFYNLSRVFNVTLENIRLIPWEQNRRDPKKKVGAGTYGISGARMLNCTFRNLTAEGSWLHWGVFGTNINKNFRIEKCRLNRVDVHFHCWNLTIQDSEIGLRGISITGGGDLTIENTVQDGNTFVNFRHDFGAKWDGNIRIRNCKLTPSRDRPVAILSSSPGRFDYGYPIGCGRTIDIENLQVDYSGFPESTAPIWLLRVANFSKTEDGARLFFAHHFTARNVTVLGRQQGVRLWSVPDPYHYDLGREGGYDGKQLKPNCLMAFENIQLEAIPASAPNDPDAAHLRLGNKGTTTYQDAAALYPQIRVTNCPGLSVYLGGSAADVIVTDSTVDRFTAAAEGPLRGKLTLENCSLAPQVQAGRETIYALDAELGTHLTNCTLHAPRIGGASKPAEVDRFGFVKLNKRVRYYQLNTALGNDLIEHCQAEKIELLPSFIAMLKAHHGLEPEDVRSE